MAMTQKETLIKKIVERLIGIHKDAPLYCDLYLEVGDENSNCILRQLWLDYSNNVVAKIDWTGHTTEEPISVLSERVLKDIVKNICKK